ncbi:two-component system, sensor histidine kinase YesM [Paenibacillus sp. yr247]|uniref:sensor histidine kinase n=1 Tax=Paenibacillus sp. yr247 TaxID=1761880 RepID=UPI0008860EAC|nr:sensor histidine kinase [Paenibacillus sp. yr247]SDO25004.1 two-component system, sensor histidine kinase YesM [Paenibacillus sp. yr247]
MEIRNMTRRLLLPFQMSMRYKLMILMVIIAVLPLTLVTIFAAKTTKQSLSLEIIRSNESRMDWAAKYFDEKFSQLHSVAYSLLMDNNLFPITNGESMSTGNGLDAGKLYIDEKLRSLYVANNNNIVSISLYLNAKQRMYIVDKDAVRSTDQWVTLVGNWSEIANNHQTVNKIVKSTRNNFKLVRSMNRFEDHEILGGVFIEARWNMMDNVINMIHSEPNSQVLVLDAQGNNMYNPYPGQTMIDQEMLEKAIHSPMEPGFIKSKQGILFYQPVVSADLWIVKFIPISYVNQGASTTLSFSFYTAMVSVLLAIILSVLIAYFTTKPIIRLTRSMKAVEHQNFNVGVDKIRSDEIGTLERRFNSMLQKMKELIQIEYKSKIEKRTAQLKAMQAQINPHFLYNALQSIGGVALSRNAPEIYEHVRALSELFRYTIKMKSDIVTVADEIEHVTNYLQIQKLRFQDMIHIQIDIEEDCGIYQLPKFILQPIVENCFVHGLEGQMEKWLVTIRVEKMMDEIEISIEDNGLGMDEVRLEEIRRQLSRWGEDQVLGESMGMNNVNSRIKLIFGQEYGMFVTSSKGVGTTVKVVIPAIIKGEEPL